MRPGVPTTARPARITVNVPLAGRRPTDTTTRRGCWRAQPQPRRLSESDCIDRIAPETSALDRREISPVGPQPAWSRALQDAVDAQGRDGGRGSPRHRALPRSERCTRPPHRPSHARGKIGPIGRETVPRSGRWRDRPGKTLSVQVVRSKPRHANVGAVSASPTPPVSFAHNCSLLSTQPMQRAMFCRPKTWRSSPYMLATQSDKTTTS
jgi:hypothetical protein